MNREDVVTYLTWLVSAAGAFVFCWWTVGLAWYWSALIAIVLLASYFTPLFHSASWLWTVVWIMTTGAGIHACSRKTGLSPPISYGAAVVGTLAIMGATVGRDQRPRCWLCHRRIDPDEGPYKKCLTCGDTFHRTCIVDEERDRCPSCGGTHWGWE